MPYTDTVMTTLDPKSRHKPSQKLTLEEVLKSLQDLIRTDLLENEHTPGAAAPQPGDVNAAPPSHSTTPVDAAFSMTQVSADIDNLNEVVRSLSELIAKELDTAQEQEPFQAYAPYPADDFTPFDESPAFDEHEFSDVAQASPPMLSEPAENAITVEPDPEPRVASEPLTEHASPSPQALTPLGEQQDLFLAAASPEAVTSQAATRSAELTLGAADTTAEMTFDENPRNDAATSYGTDSAPEILETTDAHAGSDAWLAEHDRLADEPVTAADALNHESDLTLPVSDPAPSTAPAVPMDDLLPSDIPVLQNIFSAPPSAAGLALLSPERARDAVIRAIAKLNIEMRQSGDRGLDPKTIHRLQNFVRMELEQATKK